MKNLIPKNPIQIQEILENPSNDKFISSAISYEKRLRFHGDVSMEPSGVLGGAANEFFKYVQNILPRDKYAIFLSLFTFPVYTNELTQKVYSGLKKVFDGKNPFRQLDFSSPEIEKDFNDYWESLGGDDKWQTKSWEQMKSAPNSILVIDLDETPTSDPKPYYYFLDISKVFDFEKNDNNGFEYLAYFIDKEETKFVFLDSFSYRVFQVKDKKIISLLTDNKHFLGYTPAVFFWTDELGLESHLKGQPVSVQLGNLNHILYYAISKRQSENQSQWPVYWGFAQDCDYKESGLGIYCDGGFIKRGDDYLLTDAGAVKRCPICSDKRLTGPGSFVEVPLPEENQPGLTPPVGLVSVDVPGLEYSKKQLSELETSFVRNCIGVEGSTNGEQAFNELQIAASYENRVSILKDVKKNFEKAQEFLFRTMALLRYNPAQFRSVVVDLGTDFYLFNKVELLEMYGKAKTSGASDIVLDNIFYQILEVEHKNNPLEFERAITLMNLEPFRHQSKKEVFDLFKSSPELVPVEELSIKLNFSNFIDRFERENLPINQFGKNLEFFQKINIIKQTLINYGNEQRPKVEKGNPEGNPEGGNQGDPNE